MELFPCGSKQQNPIITKLPGGTLPADVPAATPTSTTQPTASQPAAARAEAVVPTEFALVRDEKSVLVNSTGRVLKLPIIWNGIVLAQGLHVAYSIAHRFIG